MTNPTGNITLPFIPGTQWRHGEPLDDLKMHTRFDEPMDELGEKVRTFGQDWAQFFGVITSAAAYDYGQVLDFEPVVDTAGRWQIGTGYYIPWDGIYCAAMQIRNAGALLPMWPEMTVPDAGILDADIAGPFRGAAIDGNGAGFTWIGPASLGQLIIPFTGFPFTPDPGNAPAGYISNYFSIAQIGW